MIFAPGIITVLVVLLLAPVVLVAAFALDILAVTGRFRMFLARQNPRDQELTKASWGLGVLALLALGLWLIGSEQINAFLTALQNFAPMTGAGFRL